MKNIRINIDLIVLLLFLVQILLSSCSSNKVVSSFFIQKRKYTKGYHYALASKKKSSDTFVKKEKTETNFVSDELVLADNNTKNEPRKGSTIDFLPLKDAPGHFIRKNAIQEMLFKKNTSEFSCCQNKKHRAFIFHPQLYKKEFKKDGGRISNIKIGVAIASLCCILLATFSIFMFEIGLGLFLFIMGIVFGIFSLTAKNNRKGIEREEKEKAKEEMAKGFAIAGIAFGIVLLFFVLLVIGLIALLLFFLGDFL